MWRGVALGLAGAAMVTASWAADAPKVVTPVILPVAAKPAANPFDGFYLGGHAGYGWANRFGCTDNDFPPECAVGDKDFNYNQRGWLVGAQTGLNHFFGNNGLFLGAEVTASLTGITGNLTEFSAAFNGPGDWRYLATATGKLGWAGSNLAVYGELGVGIGGFSYGARRCNFDSNHQGIVYGVGAELATKMDNTLFVEWNRYDFQNKDASCLGNSSTIGVITKPVVDVVRFGFNHYFN